MASLPSTYVEGFHDRKAVEAMEYRTLGKTGLKISKLSLGGAPFSNLFGTCNENECIELVRQAIKQGINYIDTAPCGTDKDAQKPYWASHKPIAKEYLLAVWTAIQCKNISGNLIGMMNMNELKANLDVAQNGISEHENMVLKHIQEKHLSKVKGHQWNEEDWIKHSWKSLKK